MRAPSLVPLVLLASSLAAQRALPAGGREALQVGPAPIRFAVVGDFGTTSAASFQVAARVRALDPLFVVTLGDNNYPSGSALTIDANIGQHYHEFIAPYVGSYGPGAAMNAFYPCLGNHDWLASGAQPYLDYFELPGNERYYEVRRGPVHLFVLDSDVNEPDGIRSDSLQADWLRNALQHSSAPFKFVTLHHAPYNSSDNHGSQGDLQWPFKEWGASLVLSGHDHLYERLSVSGLPFVTNGLGGQSPYGFNEPLGGSAVRFNDEHGLLLVEADSEFAHLRFVTSSDSVQDDFVLPAGGIDPGTVELIPEDAFWRYNDSGLLAPGWKQPGFDDSGWPAGRAQLGYGDGDESTVVGFGGNPNQRHVTTWFRRSFSLTSPDEFETLQLRLLRDDGAVVYLNGVEVARANMPAGPIGPTTLASTSVANNEERTFYPYVFGTGVPFDVRPRLMRAGKNVLAVEIHQVALNSSDISFAAELVGLKRGTNLLPRGSTWRYLDTGVPPGPSWNAPGFDDSPWPTGPAQLGYGEGDEVTELAAGPTTTWFRNTFQVSNAAAVNWLALRLLRDDGAIVYLNGVETARFDLPRTGVTPATPASHNVGSADEDRYEETSLDPRLLVNGPNTIAVELHQASASADLSFDLELVAH